MGLGNVTGWITVKGVHVPIYDGESKEQAVKRYADSKNKSKTRIQRGKTVAEKKILDAAQTSSSKYTLSNIKVVIDPRGDLNIRTKKDNRDIVTLRRNSFTDSQIDDLRDMGYIKRFKATTNIRMQQNKLLNAQDELKSINNKLKTTKPYSENGIKLRKQKVKLEEQIAKLNKKGIK